MDKVLKELEPIFQDVFDAKDLTLKPDTSAADIEDWDSLTHIRLVVAIEKHFGIKFALGELQNAQNVGDMAALVAGKLSK